MKNNSEFRIWVNMLVPSNLLSEALKIVENFVVVTKMNMNPILSYFKKLGFLDRISRKLMNYFDHIGRKTNDDVKGFNRILNKYLNSPHPNIFKFVDHLKTLDADMVLKCTEFKRNPFIILFYLIFIYLLILILSRR